MCSLGGVTATRLCIRLNGSAKTSRDSVVHVLLKTPDNPPRTSQLWKYILFILRCIENSKKTTTASVCNLSLKAFVKWRGQPRWLRAAKSSVVIYLRLSVRRSVVADPQCVCNSSLPKLERTFRVLSVSVLGVRTTEPPPRSGSEWRQMPDLFFFTSFPASQIDTFRRL